VEWAPQAARRLSSGHTVVEVKAAAPTLRGGLLVQVKGSNSDTASQVKAQYKPIALICVCVGGGACQRPRCTLVPCT